MSPILIFVLCYFFLINLTAAIVTIYDKHLAKIKKWRISEKSLLLFSAFGGSAGMYITMRLIRHKTRKAKFMAGIPAIFLGQLLLAAAVIWALWRQGILTII